MVWAGSIPGRQARALLLVGCWTALCVLWVPRQPLSPGPASAPAASQPENQVGPDIARKLPSTSFNSWHRSYSNKIFERKECAPFPSVFDIEYYDKYWQTLRSSQGVFHLYSAYLDVRSASRIGPAVRLLVVHDRIKHTTLRYCQLWFTQQSSPVIVDVLEYTPIWNKRWSKRRDGELQTYLLACAVPAEMRAYAMLPVAVSLVEKPCDRATNCLRVHFDEPPDHVQKEFAVCVKGLDFQHEDLSVRLVEWIELVQLLGADKVFFYELQVHPNISKVLAYYSSRGIVESTPITLPTKQNLSTGWAARLRRMYVKKTMHERQMEVIPYNDCLYRHMYQYRWLAILDIDEVIVPLQDPDWSSLMKRVMPLASEASWIPPRSSYHVSNVYYLDQLQRGHGAEGGAPRYMHMLQHVYRTRNFSEPGQYVKAFHETSRVVALHNHFARACLGGPCLTYAIDTELARLQHYRADCASSLGPLCPARELRAPVRDAALWRWADRLVPRVKRALAELELLPLEAVTR